MKQGRIKIFSLVNPESSCFHRENGQFVGLLEHDLVLLYTRYRKRSSQCYDLEAMSSNNTASIFLPIGTTMNGVRHRKMLGDKLKIHMSIHKCYMFMQDYAPCHRSKLVSDLFKKKNIKTLGWPGNILNFNPIENLWAMLKDKVADEHPISAKDLKMLIKRKGFKKLQLNSANTWCIACLVACKLLSRTKMDMHEN